MNLHIRQHIWARERLDHFPPYSPVRGMCLDKAARNHHSASCLAATLPWVETGFSNTTQQCRPALLKRPPSLRQVGAAEVLEDLRVPSGNRLENLKGDRTGQHSAEPCKAQILSVDESSPRSVE